MQRKEIGGMACLVLTAMIWGFAFVSQVQGMASMSPLFFGATRFTLGALSLIPLLWSAVEASPNRNADAVNRMSVQPSRLATV